MSKPLNSSEIEPAKGITSKAERREQERRRLREEIIRNQNRNGVIVIPPPKREVSMPEEPKLRVAAYCRVSTQEEQQLSSFEMQVHHYRQKIEGNPAWELVEIYQDEGVSGTSIHKRLGFQKMISDALEGKIDLILTKGISRFGRNILDILDNLRKLSSMNPPVTVSFETEGITSTGNGSNNLLIAILSALAELESQQKSEAIKTGIRWRMADGTYKFSVRNTLGYYRDHFGRVVIEPTEAKIVEYIYASCLEGASASEIAAALTEQQIKSPLGLDCWSAGTVRSILRNEKYCGDALMQKTYTEDFRTHKSVKNIALTMYYKPGHHEAIIRKDDWNRVQEILSFRHMATGPATVKRLGNRFVVSRVKDGLFKGCFMINAGWTTEERREFIKIIEDII